LFPSATRGLAEEFDSVGPEPAIKSPFPNPNVDRLDGTRQIPRRRRACSAFQTPRLGSARGLPPRQTLSAAGTRLYRERDPMRIASFFRVDHFGRVEQELCKRAATADRDAAIAESLRSPGVGDRAYSGWARKLGLAPPRPANGATTANSHPATSATAVHRSNR